MIPVNPCGYACDIGRAPFKARYRLFADSDETVEVRWYKVPWGTPWLPFPSAILNPRYDDEPWARTGVGPVLAEQYPFSTWQSPPLPDAPHICGTPEEFVDGVTFDPERNVQYTTQGLPTCCVGGGGVVIGGDWESASTGGVVIGGDWETTPGGVLVGGEFASATLGGVVIGGDDWDVIPPPGTSCVDAGPITLGVTYHRTARPGVDQWYYLDLTIGTYHIDKPGGDGADQPSPGVSTGTCPGGLISVPLSHGFGSSCWQFTALANARYWVHFTSPAAPIEFDFTVSTGPC